MGANSSDMPLIDWPRISVVTPSLNQGAYLEQTILSVLSQGYPNLEYILMDGGSTDESLGIIRRYAPSLAHWESNPDAGQYDAVQRGLIRSHGEVMAYLNSDDLYLPWTLRVVGEIFAAFPRVEWLTTSCIAAAPSDGRFPIVSIRYNRSRRRFLETRGRLLESRNFIQQEATFWRRGLWERSGGRMDTRLKYAGDFELWARFFEHASLVTVNIPLALFRYHRRQKTSDLKDYLREAESVLSRYPRPIRVPALLIRALNLLNRRRETRRTWLGARSDRVEYNPQSESWSYKSYFEWRE